MSICAIEGDAFDERKRFHSTGTEHLEGSEPDGSPLEVHSDLWMCYWSLLVQNQTPLPISRLKNCWGQGRAVPVVPARPAVSSPRCRGLLSRASDRTGPGGGTPAVTMAVGSLPAPHWNTRVKSLCLCLIVMFFRPCVWLCSWTSCGPHFSHASLSPDFRRSI